MDNTTAKIEMFRAAIDKQAEAELSAFTAEMHARKEAAGRTRTELETQAALEDIRAETARISAQYRKEVSKCDYEMKKAVLNHRNELINEFFAETEEKLRKFALSEEYGAYLKRSLEAVRSAIALDSATLIYARPQDVDIVRALTSCEVTADNSIRLGGLRAVCRNKNVFCDATLDNALEDEKKAFIEKTELRL